MAVLRGKGLGLELALGGREFEEAFAELQGKLAERPGFYAGTTAVAALGTSSCSAEQMARLEALLGEHGITLRGMTTSAADAGEELARRRAMRPKREVQLSDAARSLVADFEGARADIAQRRQRGQTSVRRAAAPAVLQPAPLAATSEAPSTLYHVGTLRGGQSLSHLGNVVVVGDVNPGAEIVASGDILIFGALRGVAHAGAQGDESAQVHALELAPTQLRIATYIAADAGDRASAAVSAETACVRDGRIAIFSKGGKPH